MKIEEKGKRRKVETSLENEEKRGNSLWKKERKGR